MRITIMEVLERLEFIKPGEYTLSGFYEKFNVSAGHWISITDLQQLDYIAKQLHIPFIELASKILEFYKQHKAK